MKSRSIKAPKPYRGYRVYGPRLENTGRWSVSLWHPETKRQFTKSLARFVMEVGLGKKLRDSQHVDHIDGDPHNDRWDNLQVLEVRDNVIKGSTNGLIARKFIAFYCPVCGKRNVKRNAKAYTNESRVVLVCNVECLARLPSIRCRTTDTKLIRKMELSCYSMRFEHTYNKQGHRIPRKTKGLRRLHRFVRAKGLTIM